jgi:protein-S-isoprenylcysteine O-methyltransferase Ste14
MQRKKVLPPTYLLITIVLTVAFHFLLPIAHIILFPWNLLGLLPFIIGIAINIIADQNFKNVGTTIKPYETSAKLVTTGLFTFSRNPMYVGATLILLGLAVFLGSLMPFVPVIVFPVLMDRIFILVEEKMLEESFGEVWMDYKRKVRRWI